MPARAVLSSPLASYGVTGVDHLEAGDVVGDGRPILRVLGAVLGSDRDAQHNRHLQLGGAHGLPLGELVKDFVSGAAHEIGVHELGHGAAAFESVAHGGADNGGFGDGRVEQAVIRQGLGEAAVDGEGAAPVAVFFAESNHGGVDRVAIEHRFKEGVANVERLHLGHGLAVGERGADLAGDLLDARIGGEVLYELGRAVVAFFLAAVGEHHLVDQRGADADARRGFQVDGQLEHLEHERLGGRAGLVELRAAERAAFHHAAMVGQQRVGLLPLFDLFLGAVAGSVRGRMAADAIGDGVEKNRAAALGDDLFLAPEGVDERQWIVAVDALGVHLLGVDSGAQAGDELHAHGFAKRLAAHAVVVVHAVEDDGQAPAERGVPQLAVLVHRRKRDAFPDRPAGKAGVADVADDDAGLAVDPLVERGAGGDGAGSADDGVVRIDAEGCEEGVHGAAQAAVEAGIAREDLAVGAEDQEPLGQGP